jgi:hypothetical protein
MKYILLFIIMAPIWALDGYMVIDGTDYRVPITYRSDGIIVVQGQYQIENLKSVTLLNSDGSFNMTLSFRSQISDDLGPGSYLYKHEEPLINNNSSTEVIVGAWPVTKFEIRTVPLGSNAFGQNKE